MGLFGEIQSLNNCVKKKLFSLKKEDDNICPKPLQGAIINYLYENKKKDIYQKDLEIAFNISKAAISDVLNTMEKNEMIERVQSDLDARYKKIILFWSPQSNILSLKFILASTIALAISASDTWSCSVP